MCTRTPTQEQKQILDLTKKITKKNIYIYRGLINKSAPLASLNYNLQSIKRIFNSDVIKRGCDDDDDDYDYACRGDLYSDMTQSLAEVKQLAATNISKMKDRLGVKGEGSTTVKDGEGTEGDGVRAMQESNAKLMKTVSLVCVCVCVYVCVGVSTQVHMCVCFCIHRVCVCACVCVDHTNADHVQLEQA